MRLYERALPEMPRFRDSGEIMYEVPLCSSPRIPFHLNRASADFLTPGEIPRFRYTYNSAGRRKGKKGEKGRGEERKERKGKGEGAGLTNNPVKTYRGSQPPRISRSISLSLFSLLFFSINILRMQEVFRREISRIVIVSPFEII